MSGVLHEEPHPWSGKTVLVGPGAARGMVDPGRGVTEGELYQLEDWWDRVYGASWMNANGNPAALHYAARIALGKPNIPIDNEVVYGKIHGIGVLLHVSEIEEIPEDRSG